MLNLTESQIAWLAGIIEGEGCIYLREGSEKHYLQCRIRVTMTDQDVVARLHALVPGSYMMTYPPQPNRKRQYCWHVTNRELIISVLAALLPWLGHRRRAKAVAVTEYLLANPPKPRNSKGERNGRAKISTEGAMAIRAARGTKSAIALASEYGVSASSIYDVWSRRSWLDPL